MNEGTSVMRDTLHGMAVHDSAQPELAQIGGVSRVADIR